MHETSTAELVVFLLLFIFYIASVWRTFEKAGQPGWAAIVPIYNWYILIKITGKPGWWVFLFLIPVVNLIVLVWVLHLLSKSFGQNGWFTTGLLLLGFIFWPVLGFGTPRYLGPYGDPAAFRAAQQTFEFEQQANEDSEFFRKP